MDNPGKKLFTVIIKEYFNSLSMLLTCFNCQDFHDQYPIEDHTNDKWRLTGSFPISVEFDCGEGSEKLQYSEKIVYDHSRTGTSVNRSKYYTLILIRNCCGGSNYLAVFDNDNEITAKSEL
jgi:hypothetical protein